MKRFALAIAAALLVALAIGTSVSNAELENQIFTSKKERIRIVVPPKWRATDQDSYPGMLLWMMRPNAKMVLTSEAFTRDVYCSWPPECRASNDPLPTKLACALRRKLEAQRIKVGPVQAGPKENGQAGMPSVWFELEDNKRFLRQALAVGEDRIVSLTLTATSADARNQYIRDFERALRTLRPLTLEEMGSALPPPEQVVMQMVVDASVADAGAPADAGPAGPATFESAPVSKVAPVGSCANR
jgi:hypothetical protein